MKKLYLALIAVPAFLIAFVGVAFAAGAVTPQDSSILDLAKPVWEAVAHGQYWVAASLALVLAVAAVKKYHPGKLGEYANTDVGGAALVLLGAFGTTLATGLLATGTGVFSLTLAWTSLKIALGAAGGYSLLKKFAAPILTRIADKAPAWAKPIFALVLWAFTSPDPIAKAEAAGAAAVKADPAPGAAGAAGTPTDI